MKKVWQNEEKGLLLGIIVEESTEKFSPLKLKDTNNKTWQITISEKTNIKHDIKLKTGERIKLIGEKKSENLFEVLEIRPFIGNGKGYDENHK